MRITADMPYSHMGPNGTHFDCDRCDLRTPIRVRNAPADAARLAVDVGSMISHHVLFIHCELRTGFAGYDSVRYEFS